MRAEGGGGGGGGGGGEKEKSAAPFIPSPTTTTKRDGLRIRESIFEYQSGKRKRREEYMHKKWCVYRKQGPVASLHRTVWLREKGEKASRPIQALKDWA